MPDPTPPFNEWLDTFLEEKGIDKLQRFTVTGPSGANNMSVLNVVAAMKTAPLHERKAIKAMFVRLDFHNANCLDYIKHLAQAIAL